MKRAPTKILPPVEYLRECFVYNQDTGELVWRARPREHFTTERAWTAWNGGNAHRPAGTMGSHGYYQVHIGRLYRSHRLIWKLMTGEEPPVTIDHRDRDRSNNRWSNLRAATSIEQSWNSCLSKGTTKRRGVVEEKGRYLVRIKVGGVRRRLGSFDTLEEAASVYDAAAREACGGFYSGGQQ